MAELRRNLDMRITTIISIFFILSAASLQAISVKFVARNVPKALYEVTLVGDEKVFSQFAVPTTNFSEAIEVTGRRLQLKTSAQGQVCADIVLPGEGKDYVVLLVPKTSTEFTAAVIDVVSASFRAGDFYLHNDLQVPLLAKIGKTKAIVKAGEGQVVEPTGAKEERYYNVALGVREKKDRVISQSRWPVSKVIRTYVFFYQDPKTKEIDYRAVDEFVPQVVPQN